MKGWAWWSTSVIPATWEAEVGESWFEVSQGKSSRPFLKNKLKQKDWGQGPSGRAFV
jgi:hypothetical protein